MPLRRGRPHHHQRKQRAYLKTRGPKVGHLRTNGFTGSIVPATGLRAERPFGAPNSVSSTKCAAMPEPNSAFVHRKSVPSTHIRCKITPILRASATLARFSPRRFATSTAQRFSAEKARHARQQDVRRLIESRAHHRVANACDPSCHVGLARLIFLRGQSEQRPDRFRFVSLRRGPPCFDGR